MGVPCELVEQFARGNGVVFVGAGLSRGAGLPGWGELLAPLDDVLETVLRYNRLNGDTKERRAKYEQPLRDRPWRSCPCEICRDIGIQAIIFRGNDRNRRRGFHNTWVFYRQFYAAQAAGGWVR